MKRILFVFMTLSMLISFASCNIVNKEKSTTISTKAQLSTIKAEQKITEQLIDSFKNQDSSELKSILKDKLEIIRWFSSGNGSRGKDTLLTINKDDIPSNLQFNVDNETPINLLNVFSEAKKEYTHYQDDSRKLDSKDIKSVNAYVNEINKICVTNKIKANENSIITCKNGFLFCNGIYFSDDIMTGNVAVFLKDSNNVYYLFALINMN